MQLDGKSFCGDVVLESVNFVVWYEDNILDQKIYNVQTCSDFYCDDYDFV